MPTCPAAIAKGTTILSSRCSAASINPSKIPTRSPTIRNFPMACGSSRFWKLNWRAARLAPGWTCRHRIPCMIGDWMGTIQQGGAELRLIVHIRQTADGSLEGTLDNLDVGRMAIPLTVDMFENSTLRFHAWSIDGTYEGTIRRRDQRIDGTWR